MAKKALFLDRDGVVTKSVRGEAPKTPEEVSLIKEVFPLIRKANNYGFLNIIISNQPDVALGNISQKTKKELEKRVKRLLSSNNLPIEAIYYCYHHPEGKCSCRKPRPGMLFTACKKFNLDLKKSYFIGDRATDVKAGKQAGVTTILFDPEKRQAGHLKKHGVKADYTIYKLKEAIKIICKQ